MIQLLSDTSARPSPVGDVGVFAKKAFVAVLLECFCQLLRAGNLIVEAAKTSREMGPMIR